MAEVSFRWLPSPRNFHPFGTILAERYLAPGETCTMPLFKTRSAAVFGIDALPVDVEVDLYRSGMARDFMLVGMPDTAVRESRERIKSALMNSISESEISRSSSCSLSFKAGLNASSGDA